MIHFKICLPRLDCHLPGFFNRLAYFWILPFSEFCYTIGFKIWQAIVNKVISKATEQNHLLYKPLPRLSAHGEPGLTSHLLIIFYTYIYPVVFNFYGICFQIPAIVATQTFSAGE
jgi:hypothetical protein